MATNTRSYALSEFPHLKERLDALVLRDYEVRERRLWNRFKDWSYTDLSAALRNYRDELPHLEKMIAYFDKQLAEQGIAAVEISVPVSPSSARRIDVPALLLDAEAFSEIDWEDEVSLRER